MSVLTRKQHIKSFNFFWFSIQLTIHAIKQIMKYHEILRGKNEKTDHCSIFDKSNLFALNKTS